MFRKILIANRGEIACRVIATARRMGIQTVAVFSDADAGALHVSMADEAVRIGPAPVSESYLRGEAILRAALQTGAEAVHPGYGFLSENPDFVASVLAAGLVFIGPSETAIRAMGLKDAAKLLMENAGVPVVPGYHGAAQGADFLAERAADIGYPVLIKARAGGGGKGMRLVDRPEDFSAALEGAQREALSSFGDAAVLIERYITNPRHIEIQVFGDTHGNVLHLFERDCSLQRRHQKVIEEAPAPGMPKPVREAMAQAAVTAAKAIGYHGAGTVEFIADASRGLRPDCFWFMEMNTRLQVEHPVSEAITKLDFVELQLRVAAGEKLPFAQKDLAITGHAFEARLYAEDVPKGFLPAIGRLEHLRFPEGVAFRRGPLRIDSGVRQGDVISPFYDPLIAKIIVHGPDRATALAQLSRALAGCQLAGTVTNLGFLQALTQHKGFAAGAVDTGLIARDLPGLLQQAPPDAAVTALAAIAALGLLEPRDAADPFSALAGFRHWAPDSRMVTLEREGAVQARVFSLQQDTWRVEFAGETITLQINRRDGGFAVLSGGHLHIMEMLRSISSVTIFAGGISFGFGLPQVLAASDDHKASDRILAPMPGVVKLVAASVGQAVVKGEPLLVLEAMKMEHTMPAPRDGVVAQVLVAFGDQVSDGAVLLLLEPKDG